MGPETRLPTSFGSQRQRPPLPAESTPRDVGGRGLIIVDALADVWGVDTPAAGNGKTVWAEFDRTQAEPHSSNTDDEPPPDDGHPG